MLFKPKPPVDLEEFEWLMACFAWVHRTLGQTDRSNSFQPMLVRHDTPGIADAAGATALFIAIKNLAGLEQWDCDLRQGEAEPEPASSGLVIEQRGTRALGTFSLEASGPALRYDAFGQPIHESSSGANCRPVVTYSPELLRDPEAMAATFAHELAHLICHDLGAPPGGFDLQEHATDCVAVYMGFGVFLANSARHYSQFQDGTISGWRSSTAGYLSERALVTLLAMFVRVFGTVPDLAAEPLKAYLRVDFSKALKYIDWRHHNLEMDLLGVDFAEWN